MVKRKRQSARFPRRDNRRARRIFRLELFVFPDDVKLAFGLIPPAGVVLGIMNPPDYHRITRVLMRFLDTAAATERLRDHTRFTGRAKP